MGPNFKRSLPFWMLAAVALLSTVWNLRLMPLGQHYDLFLFQCWGNRALAEGLPSVYRGKLDRPENLETTNHPPLGPYLFHFYAWLNYRLFGDNEFDPRVNYEKLRNHEPLATNYVVIIKFFPFLANTAIGLLIFSYLRTRNGERAALAAAAAHLLNPALIYVTAYWGQADAIGAMLMLASVLLMGKDRPLASTVCFTIGVLTQLRVIILLPVLVWVMFGKYGSRKIALIVLVNAALILAVCLPYLAAGQAWQLFRVATDTTKVYPYVSCRTFNLWFLLSPHNSFAQAWKDTTRVGGVSLRTAGWALFALYTAFVLYRQKGNRDLPLAAAAVCFAFYMLPTRVHSRYLFPFLVFFPLSIGANRRYWLIYWLLSLNFLLNLMMVLPFPHRGCYIFRLIQSAFDSLTAGHSLIAAGIAISGINLVLFLWFSRIVLAGASSPGRSREPRCRSIRP